MSDKQAALRPSTSRYRIGPDDAIRVQVVGHKEFDTTATVSERRTILLPVVGEVDVADLTIEELRNRLVSTYKNGYLRSPQVVVDIVDYNNMKVWVFGFVNSPGERRLTGPTTLMSLLSLVGNAKSSAGSTVTIERTNTTMAQSPTGGLMPVSESDTITVDLNLLLRDGDLSQDVDLQNGDKIYVPPTSSKVYALGEVVKPGFYPYREGMQISDLIQLAGGLTEFANPKKVKIRRDGLPNPLQVNYKAFVKDGDVEHNVPLMDGDRVIINSSFLF